MNLSSSFILSICFLGLLTSQLAVASSLGRLFSSNFESIESELDSDGGLSSNSNQDARVYQKRLIPSIKVKDLASELQNDIIMDDLYDHLMKKCNTLEDCRKAMAELIKLNKFKRNQDEIGPKRPFRWGK